MYDICTSLNHQQLAAVEYTHAHSLIIAGAGTGKTHTLITKVKYLISKRVNPAHILLLTFTNKAAKEMMSRVFDAYNSDQSSIMGGTFHKIGILFLRRWGNYIAFPDTFSILDRDDAKSIFKRIRKEKEEQLPEFFPKDSVLLSLYSFVRNKDANLLEIIQDKYPMWQDYIPLIEAFINGYEQFKRSSLAFDFDDLLVYFNTLLDHPEALKHIHEHYPYVFVDEFQDLCPLQYKILNKLVSPSCVLTAVGDDAQTIYSFRGAHFSGILKFQDAYPSASIFKLELNYRSSENILNYANAIIRQNIHQYAKTLVSADKKIGPFPKVCCFDSDRDQCTGIAGSIASQIQEGYSPSEIAILYRAHSQSLTLQMALSKKNIPFNITSGLRFSELAHVKDLLSFVKWYHNPRDLQALTRFLSMFPAMGPKTILKIQSEIPALRSFEDMLAQITRGMSKKSAVWWDECLNIYKHILSSKHDAEQMLSRFFESKFFNEHMVSTYENQEQRQDDLEELVQFSRQFNDMQSFLNDMSLLSNQEDDHDLGSKDKIVLSTVHQAKGLEWETVFILGMTEGRFPSYQTLNDEGDIEEERRLFYVAATRAKHYLFITFPRVDETNRQGNYYTKPSQFLDEIEKELFEFKDFSR